MTDERKPRGDAEFPGSAPSAIEDDRGEDIPPRLLELAQKLESALKDRVAALKRRH
ncbi:hypothetical protein [Albidovulum sp.]|uniref:hypothetical protein n=1 Tax=Albidovulum sp. TaxID=1872424 RepID=UPI0039B89892